MSSHWISQSLRGFLVTGSSLRDPEGCWSCRGAQLRSAVSQGCCTGRFTDSSALVFGTFAPAWEKQGQKDTGLFNSHCSNVEDGCWQSSLRAVQTASNANALPGPVCAEAPSIAPTSQDGLGKLVSRPLGHSGLHVLVGPSAGMPRRGSGPLSRRGKGQKTQSGSSSLSSLPTSLCPSPQASDVLPGCYLLQVVPRSGAWEAEPPWGHFGAVPAPISSQ